MFSKHSQKIPHESPTQLRRKLFGILLAMLGIGKQMLESIDRQTKPFFPYKSQPQDEVIILRKGYLTHLYFLKELEKWNQDFLKIFQYYSRYH